MVHKRTSCFIRGIIHFRASQKHAEVVELLHNFVENPPPRSSENLETLCFQYYYTGLINSFFMTGQFTEGLSLVPRLEKEINKYQFRIDSHRILVFYYKIALLIFWLVK